MKRLCILHIFSLVFLTTLLASPTDSVSTVYRDGEFVTYCQVLVKASDSISRTIVNDFIYQNRYDLDALFGWAFKGLNLRKEKSGLMVINYKSTEYNKEKNFIKTKIDLIIPNVITFPDILMYSRLTKKEMSNGETSMTSESLYPNSVMKKTVSTLSIIPIKKEETWYKLESHIRFGKFFDFFITQKRFRQIMQWRLNKLLNNLRIEAERRENLKNRNKGR